MNKTGIKKGLMFPLLGLMIFSAIGVGVASADDGGQARPDGFGFGHHKGMMDHSGLQLIPGNLKGDFRPDFKNMTDAEKEAFKVERQKMMEEKRQAFEDFTGVTKEEMKALHQEGKTMGDILIANGKTEADAQVFLTNQANERIDVIVAKQGLSTTEEQTLRSRVTEFVSNILSRWFNK